MPWQIMMFIERKFVAAMPRRQYMMPQERLSAAEAPHTPRRRAHARFIVTIYAFAAIAALLYRCLPSRLFDAALARHVLIRRTKSRAARQRDMLLMRATPQCMCFYTPHMPPPRRHAAAVTHAQRLCYDVCAAQAARDAARQPC